jgi:hypothetical protein
MKTKSLRAASLAIVFACAMSRLTAQQVVNDTNYYERYPDKLTTRIYFSQKYLKFSIPGATAPDLEYKAHTKLNLGIGATYHNFSLNVFYGFAFLNDDKDKGDTKGLDVQLHLYPRRWAIDLLAIFPKGLYLTPKGYAASSPNKYYLRPDIHVNLLGISAYKVPNKERFSYRAAITQNEWQKKSAGSPLYGGIAYYGTVKGDSALVPSVLKDGFRQQGIKNINFMAIGGGIGYAYTLVIQKHFFITASAVGNLDITSTSEEGANGKHRKIGVGPSTVIKGAFGYNSPTWNVSMNGLGCALWTKGDSNPMKYYLPAATVRLAVSYKFQLRKKGE